MEIATASCSLPFLSTSSSMSVFVLVTAALAAIDVQIGSISIIPLLLRFFPTAH